jgi:hypothetical protein
MTERGGWPVVHHGVLRIPGERPGEAAMPTWRGVGLAGDCLGRMGFGQPGKVEPRHRRLNHAGQCPEHAGAFAKSA